MFDALNSSNTCIPPQADDGMTALHYAAKAGHVGIIQLLLDTDRLTIDVKDDGGWTPLIWAAEHQEVEAVRYLLKCNAEPNLRDSVSCSINLLNNTVLEKAWSIGRVSDHGSEGRGFESRRRRDWTSCLSQPTNGHEYWSICSPRKQSSRVT